jgi:hypothetical protein
MIIYVCMGWYGGYVWVGMVSMYGLVLWVCMGWYGGYVWVGTVGMRGRDEESE